MGLAFSQRTMKMRIIGFGVPTEKATKMILNETMVDALHAIRCIESTNNGKRLNVPANELGNRLIKLYYHTPILETRELITEFMTQAGVVWLRKLLTKDVGPIASSSTRFASMNDYLSLLAANDSASELLLAQEA